MRGIIRCRWMFFSPVYAFSGCAISTASAMQTTGVFFLLAVSISSCCRICSSRFLLQCSRVNPYLCGNWMHKSLLLVCLILPQSGEQCRRIVRALQQSITRAMIFPLYLHSPWNPHVLQSDFHVFHCQPEPWTPFTYHHTYNIIYIHIYIYIYPYFPWSIFPLWLHIVHVLLILYIYIFPSYISIMYIHNPPANPT